MKKIAIVLILLLVTSSAFAQSKNVLDNTGYQWISWTSMEKEKYVVGWLSALSSLRELVYFWQTEFELTEQTNNAFEALDAWALYRGTVGDIVIILDRTYTDTGTREYKIWDVLLTLYDKEWW